MGLVLADDFFRLAHHDVDGRPRLHARAIEIGLAAALVGELMFAQRVEIRDGVLVVVNRTPPDDALSHTVLDALVREAERHGVRTWLEYLSQEARTQVTGRLVRAGHLKAVSARRFLAPTVTTFVPTDMNKAAWPWLSLSMRLRDGMPLDFQRACLAGLTVATGLDKWLLDGANPATYAYLRHVVSRLWPPMRELLAHTEAAIGTAVLSHRT
ncbi:GOLPH3/VPS74 family protein [Plantactinospora sp. CA-294935]|uniref:GOLPH3/VPS74 family protein n=1 Tax=Plantactinospora sp. CA-294935 TaxID=3240012 RepID=UPI003D8B7130